MDLSKQACVWSIEEVLRGCKKAYLWTLTFPEPTGHDFMGPAFHWFHRELTRNYTSFAGVRVWEWHRDHGLHCHFVVGVRIPVDIIRYYAKRAGFGRVHVKQIPASRAVYVAKYLSKECSDFPRGARRWAVIGAKFTKPVRVRNLQVSSKLVTFTQRKLREAEKLKLAEAPDKQVLINAELGLVAPRPLYSRANATLTKSERFRVVQEAAQLYKYRAVIECEARHGMAIYKPV